MSIYTRIVEKLSPITIHNLQRESILSYEEALNAMEREFDILHMNLAICLKESTNLILRDIYAKLEAYYRMEYKEALFPLFVPWSPNKSFNSSDTTEFIDCTRQFFIKRWKNNRYYCLPIDRELGMDVISVVPPEDIEEDIKGFYTPTAAMLDFYIHLLKEIQGKEVIG